MRRQILRPSLLLCGFALALLAGCGQKGPLYMPPPTPAAKPKPAAAPAPASSVPAAASSASMPAGQS